MPNNGSEGTGRGSAPRTIATGLIVVALALAACSPAGAPSASAPVGSQPTASGPSAGGTDPDAALAELETTVLATGPFGEDPTSPTEVMLTPEEIEEVRAMGATAAIVMHIQGDWTNAQVDGLTTTFEELGIEVISSTNGEGRTEKQVADIETVLVQDPDIIVSIPWSPGDQVAAYQQIVDQGVTLVFADNAIPGFVAGEDYVSTVSADNWGNGVASAHLMAKALIEKEGSATGKIGMVWFDIDFFVTNQRRDAFRETITGNYPGIEIVEDQGFPAGPDLAGGAETVANAMLTRNPDLDGIWAVWDQPAEGVIAAARSAGRDDLIITTEDLSLASALSIKNGEFIYGLGAQRPYDQGVTEALLAAYGLLGKEAPPYVALNALAVTQDNVLEAWTTVYHADPPAELTGD
ncbi:MAG: substrate-binding domain-containing protein [Chloroflexota bacterium]